MPPKRFPGDLSWNMASLVSSWIVGPLYGIICVYILCAHILYMKGLRGVNLMMLIVASVQFSLATGHVITLLVQLIRAFIGAAGTVDGPSIYLLDQSTPEHLAQGFFYLTNSLIGDAIMVWRLWIIWNRNFWLCVPFIVLCTVSTVTGYAAFANQVSLNPTETVFLSRLQNWLYATWALSIATQVGATLLIGYRFWKSVHWNSKGLRGSRLSIFWILVESGALYTITTIFLVGFSSTNTGAIFAASLGQISALAPTLIIVRAGLKSSGSSSSFTPAKGSINNPYYGPPPSQSFRRDVESGSSGDDSMVVHVKRATEIRLDNMKPCDISELSTVEERSSSATPK
ncbi:hypothetical protein EDB92DRAFT_1875872 [Lactarius akahatsu]|uniref:Uncharacterized protein n=1 Tax=Lactarius akahatsu TaxID=416441 RepID=A0AAD4LC36_9AGAM|nr:hypothetical protein EDB92DRAFT_1875872 [Lactarius akahatsu]